MNRLNVRFAVWVAVIATSLPAWAQWQRQTVRLNPGWNAVYLEVQPEPANVETVLGSLPLESAWMWNRPAASVQYVEDPKNIAPGDAEWLAYFPSGSPHVRARNLLEIEGGRALLIRLPATQTPVDWVITGRPVSPRYTWVGDSYNLIGFPVGDGATHTFQSLFAGSLAQESVPVLRLSSTGEWIRVDGATEKVEAGRAYWVYSKGPSSYRGRLDVESEQGRTIAFGDSLVETTIRLGNNEASPKRYFVRAVSSAGAQGTNEPVAGSVALRYQRFLVDEASRAGSIAWIPLTNRVELLVPPGERAALRLEALRPSGSGSPTGLYQSLFEISDEKGYREVWGMSLRSGRLEPATGRQLAATSPQRSPRAGLWVGNVTLDQVSFSAHPSDPQALRPAKSEFDFRIIVHVDDGGTARLLQRVLVMWRAGESAEAPSRLVVVSDESMVGKLGLTGFALRDGLPVARRFTAPAFAFDTPIAMTGNFGAGSLSCRVSTGHNDALNPFKHVYHTEHDNLDETTRAPLPDGVESYAITRDLALTFANEDRMGASQQTPTYVPGFGDTRLAGTYTETMLGVHRRPIQIGGTFTLQRVAFTGQLNDGQ